MKRPTYDLELRIEGPGVRPGAILVPDLIRICQALKDAVNRQAEAIRGGQSLRPGPKTSEVYEECTLELVGMKKGSTVLPFRLENPQPNLLLPGKTTFGEDAIRGVIDTIRRLRLQPARADAYEPGVLNSLKAVGEVLDKGRIASIEWRIPAAPDRKGIKVVLDKRVCQRVSEVMKMPSHKLESVDGVLEMVDFKDQERRCRVHPTVGLPVFCSFDESHDGVIYQWLRKPVRVAGQARINSNTGRIEDLRIEKIALLEPLVSGGKDFFTERSLEQLAEVQRVRPLKNPKKLTGGWPPEEDLDAFLEEIYSSR